ncbi:WXG100 family type VII secretion target [Rhodococcus sp. NPDC058521]|uniref:WXG100 family type VII secretion target n=1 Tax=Rhodococcus sp. NPDC058521 TaxID=3346536 RepID=UPI003651B1D2
MSGGSTNVDTAAVAQASSNVRQGAEDMQATVKMVDGRVQDIKTAWGGRASGSFQTLMDEYRLKSQKLHAALDEISSSLDTSGKTFDDSEDTVAASVSEVTSSLGDLR